MPRVSQRDEITQGHECVAAEIAGSTLAAGLSGDHCGGCLPLRSLKNRKRWEMAQLVKDFPCKHEHLISSPSTDVKSQG